MARRIWLILAFLPPTLCLHIPLGAKADIDVGVCVTGLARTFRYEGVRRNIRNEFIAPFLKGLSYRTFFALGEIDDKRPFGSNVEGFHNLPVINAKGLEFRLEDWNGECAVMDDGHHAIRHWGKFNATQARQVMRAWSPVAPRTLTGQLSACHYSEGQKVDVNRWGSMFQREQNCYTIVQEFEAEKSVKFKRILFMRPDLVFFGNVPMLAELGLEQDECFLPQGVVRQRFNDHMFLCPRELCPHYLDIGRRLQSEESITMFNDKNISCYKTPWHDHVMYAGLKAMKYREVRLQYTLMRACPAGLECARMWERFHRCQNMSAEICAEQ